MLHKHVRKVSDIIEDTETEVVLPSIRIYLTVWTDRQTENIVVGARREFRLYYQRWRGGCSEEESGSTWQMGVSTSSSLRM